MTPSGHTLPANTGKGQQMSMPTTHHGIAVGVDGSAPSKVAVDWAAREASLRDLPLTLVHVIPSSLTRVHVARGTDASQSCSELARANGHEILREARRVAEDAAKGRNGTSERPASSPATCPRSYRPFQGGRDDRRRLPRTGRHRATPAGIRQLGSSSTMRTVRWPSSTTRTH